MFSYYGSKSKIAKLYPKPIYQVIVEPFAGAAWYSLQFKTKNVILNEKYRKVFDIWDWFINSATTEHLSKNKDYYLGEDISKKDMPQPLKDFIGFCINRGSAQPRNIVQKWSCQVSSRPNWASTTAYCIERSLKFLPFIKTWEVFYGDYFNLPDIEATWFIDPPYQFGGNRYSENKIDYDYLSEWCKSRKGQVIVCENSKAKWLPFKKLTDITGQRHKTTEVFWSNI